MPELQKQYRCPVLVKVDVKGEKNSSLKKKKNPLEVLLLSRQNVLPKFGMLLLGCTA
jgi:hypothetical protein